MPHELCQEMNIICNNLHIIYVSLKIVILTLTVLTNGVKPKGVSLLSLFFLNWNHVANLQTD